MSNDKEESNSELDKQGQSPPSLLVQGANNENKSLILYERDIYFRLLVEAFAYFELDEISETKNRLEIYLQKFPSYARGLNLIGVCHWIENEVGAAMAAMERACTLEPKNVDYLCDLIYFLVYEDLIQIAEQRLRQFFYSHPEERYSVYLGLRSYDVEHCFIQSAWKTRKKKQLKVLNGNPITTAKPMKK